MSQLVYNKLSLGDVIFVKKYTAAQSPFFGQLSSAAIDGLLTQGTVVTRIPEGEVLFDERDELNCKLYIIIRGTLNLFSVQSQPKHELEVDEAPLQEEKDVLTEIAQLGGADVIGVRSLIFGRRDASKQVIRTVAVCGAPNTRVCVVDPRMYAASLSRFAMTHLYTPIDKLSSTPPLVFPSLVQVSALERAMRTDYRDNAFILQMILDLTKAEIKHSFTDVKADLALEHGHLPDSVKNRLSTLSNGDMKVLNMLPLTSKTHSLGLYNFDFRGSLGEAHDAALVSTDGKFDKANVNYTVEWKLDVDQGDVFYDVQVTYEGKKRPEVLHRSVDSKVKNMGSHVLATPGVMEVRVQNSSSKIAKKVSVTLRATAHNVAQKKHTMALPHDLDESQIEDDDEEEDTLWRVYQSCQLSLEDLLANKHLSGLRLDSPLAAMHVNGWQRDILFRLLGHRTCNQVNEFLNMCTLKKLGPGQCLMTEGDPTAQTNSLYLIVSGSVSLHEGLVFAPTDETKDAHGKMNKHKGVTTSAPRIQSYGSCAATLCAGNTIGTADMFSLLKPAFTYAPHFVSLGFTKEEKKKQRKMSDMLKGNAFLNSVKAAVRAKLHDKDNPMTLAKMRKHTVLSRENTVLLQVPNAAWVDTLSQLASQRLLALIAQVHEIRNTEGFDEHNQAHKSLLADVHQCLCTTSHYLYTQSSKHVDALVLAGTVVYYDSHEVIHPKGADSDFMYIVLSGHVVHINKTVSFNGIYAPDSFWPSEAAFRDGSIKHTVAGDAYGIRYMNLRNDVQVDDVQLQFMWAEYFNFPDTAVAFEPTSLLRVNRDQFREIMRADVVRTKIPVVPRLFGHLSHVIRILQSTADERSTAEITFMEKTLKEVHLFSLINSSLAQYVCRSATYRHVRAGEVLFAQKDAVRNVYVVLEGAFSITMKVAEIKKYDRKHHARRQSLSMRRGSIDLADLYSAAVPDEDEAVAKSAVDAKKKSSGMSTNKKLKTAYLFSSWCGMTVGVLHDYLHNRMTHQLVTATADCDSHVMVLDTNLFQLLRSHYLQSLVQSNQQQSVEDEYHSNDKMESKDDTGSNQSNVAQSSQDVTIALTTDDVKLKPKKKKKLGLKGKLHSRLKEAKANQQSLKQLENEMIKPASTYAMWNRNGAKKKVKLMGKTKLLKDALLSDHKVKFLNETELFKGMKEDRLKVLASKVTQHTYNVGEVVMKQGVAADRLIFVQEGYAQLNRHVEVRPGRRMKTDYDKDYVKWHAHHTEPEFTAKAAVQVVTVPWLQFWHLATPGSGQGLISASYPPVLKDEDKVPPPPVDARLKKHNDNWSGINTQSKRVTKRILSPRTDSFARLPKEEPWWIREQQSDIMSEPVREARNAWESDSEISDNGSGDDSDVSNYMPRRAPGKPFHALRRWALQKYNNGNEEGRMNTKEARSNSLRTVLELNPLTRSRLIALMRAQGKIKVDRLPLHCKLVTRGRGQMFGLPYCSEGYSLSKLLARPTTEDVVALSSLRTYEISVSDFLAMIPIKNMQLFFERASDAHYHVMMMMHKQILGMLYIEHHYNPMKEWVMNEIVEKKLRRSMLIDRAKVARQLTQRDLQSRHAFGNFRSQVYTIPEHTPDAVDTTHYHFTDKLEKKLGQASGDVEKDRVVYVPPMKSLSTHGKQLDAHVTETQDKAIKKSHKLLRNTDMRVDLDPVIVESRVDELLRKGLTRYVNTNNDTETQKVSAALTRLVNEADNACENHEVFQDSRSDRVFIQKVLERHGDLKEQEAKQKKKQSEMLKIFTPANLFSNSFRGLSSHLPVKHEDEGKSVSPTLEEQFEALQQRYLREDILEGEDSALRIADMKSGKDKYMDEYMIASARGRRDKLQQVENSAPVLDPVTEQNPPPEQQSPPLTVRPVTAGSSRPVTGEKGKKKAAVVRFLDYSQNGLFDAGDAATRVRIVDAIDKVEAQRVNPPPASPAVTRKRMTDRPRILPASHALDYFPSGRANSYPHRDAVQLKNVDVKRDSNYNAQSPVSVVITRSPPPTASSMKRDVSPPPQLWMGGSLSAVDLITEATTARMHLSASEPQLKLGRMRPRTAPRQRTQNSVMKKKKKMMKKKKLGASTLGGQGNSSSNSHMTMKKKFASQVKPESFSFTSSLKLRSRPSSAVSKQQRQSAPSLSNDYSGVIWPEGLLQSEDAQRSRPASATNRNESAARVRPTSANMKLHASRSAPRARPMSAAPVRGMQKSSSTTSRPSTPVASHMKRMTALRNKKAMTMQRSSSLKLL